MEPVERVVSVGAVRSGVVPLGADGMALTTTSGFETDFGNAYLGVAVTRVVGLPERSDGSDGSNAPRSSVVTIEQAGGRERNCRVVVGGEWT